VFSEDSIASFKAAAVTIGHPEEGAVTPKLWQRLTHGVVLDASGREKLDGEDYVTASLAVFSAPALNGIESGDLNEISMGYTCDVKEEPGVSPNGDRYDRIQTNIRANHVALLPQGHARAGRQARLTLDGNQTNEPEKIHMKIRFDGVDYDTASEADLKALQKRIDENEKNRTDESDRIAKLEKENGELQGKLDSEKERADKAESSVASEVTAELKFRADMSKLLPADYDFEGKDRKSVKLDAIKHRRPNAGVDSDTDDRRIDGYLLSIVEAPEDHNVKADAKTEDKTDAEKANEEYQKKLRGDSTAYTREKLLVGSK
jgi:hypothetical protein